MHKAKLHLLIIIMIIALLIGFSRPKQVDVIELKDSVSGNNKLIDSSKTNSPSTTQQSEVIETKDKLDANNDLLTTSPPENSFSNQNKVLVSEDEYYVYYLELEPKPQILEFPSGSSDELSRHDVFKEDGYLIFSTFVGIFRCNEDGSNMKNLYTRVYSGSENQITKIEDGWIYFEIASEDGINLNRVSITGDKFEDLEIIYSEGD